MTESSKLLNEGESAELAGVSLETLHQYQRFGLLVPVLNEGIVHYRERDIRTLFYTRAAGGGELPRPPRPELQPSNEEDAVPTLDEVLNQTREQVSSGNGVSLETPSVEPVSETGSPESGSLQSGALEAESAQIESQQAAPQETGAQEAVAVEKAPFQSGPAAKKAAEVPDGERAALAAEAAEIASHAGSTDEGSAAGESTADLREPTKKSAGESADAAKAEVPSLTHQHLLELNKSLKLQIDVLRDERDWLRQRIERLEARGEREQMLLLSENENVRSLIASLDRQPRRTPFWKKALPWFGVSEDK